MISLIKCDLLGPSWIFQYLPYIPAFHGGSGWCLSAGGFLWLPLPVPTPPLAMLHTGIGWSVKHHQGDCVRFQYSVKYSHWEVGGVELYRLKQLLSMEM